jgi:hypothetical protein
MLIVAFEGSLSSDARARIASQLTQAREENRIAVLQECTVSRETPELIKLEQPFGDEHLWVDPDAVASIRKGVAHGYDGPVTAITLRDGDQTGWLVAGEHDDIAAQINKARTQ